MKNKASRLAALFLSLSVMVASMAGCSSGSSGAASAAPGASGGTASATSAKDIKATVTFWHTYSANSEAKVLNEKIIPAFNQEYPNIKIKSVTMPTDNFKQQVLQAAASGSAPDVMRMDITWVPQFANLNALVAVDGMDGFSDIKSNSYEATLNTCKWKEKYYGVPLDTNTTIAIYNKADLQAAGLSAAPKTMDELADAAEKIKGQHPNGLIGISGTGMWSMAPFFLSLGGKYCDDGYTKATGYVNSNESIAALTKLVSWNDKGLIGKCMLNGQPGTWDGLKANDGYMMVNDGPWFYTLQDKKTTDNDTYAQMPADTSKSISVVGGEDMVMFQNCKNQEAAWLFMKFMFSDYAQKTMALEVNQYPVNKKVAQDSELTSNPIFKTYMQQLETSWARIPNPSIEEMDNDISLAFEKAFRHKGTVKENLDALAKQLDDLFAKNS
ncbi:extracellular solute-binding protein [Caproicibacter sp.]|uniref:extracellular solute-binding protein n=1 Tax=Caproicibacter sp. TaxID=2814884 RepID=UPI0039896C39